MRDTPPSPPVSSGPHPAHSWSRWSSFVHLALRGGDAFCARCGSRRVRRDWELAPPWKRALGIDPCRCDACGATFHVPRRAATVDPREDPADEEAMLPMPPLPSVDLEALDRDIAQRLTPEPQRDE